MAEQTVVTDAASQPDVTKTPEFQAALKAQTDQLREEHRKNFEAEYARKTKEYQEKLDADYAQAQQVRPQQPGYATTDYFVQWGEKHGVPAEAGRELASALLGHVQKTVVEPITSRVSQSELKAQRMELRQTNARLAKLDDQYHAEVQAHLKQLKPQEIHPDSYVTTLKYVIGEHVEDIVKAEAQAAVETTGKEREIVETAKPGPAAESRGAGGSGKAKITLSALQKQWAEDHAHTPEEFVHLMKKRAQRMETTGASKAQIRERLGSLLGAIEF